MEIIIVIANKIFHKRSIVLYIAGCKGGEKEWIIDYTLQKGKIYVSLTCNLSFWMQVSEQITHMDSDNYCSGMRMRRGANMKEEKFVMRFPSASDGFSYSLTCNQNDILYVKLTVSCSLFTVYSVCVCVRESSIYTSGYR